MTAVYGEHCISLSTVKRWSNRFREGRECCKDDPRPGQSQLAITPDTIAHVDELIRQERRHRGTGRACEHHLRFGSQHKS
ncbi:hypothetical protein TNCT_493781 [Trichonephila clavata]|uniref:Mos1 transposase HTH domain-containing protein n=1 Tax=Trichonephila clavata TaxID=2740835 RepID=A0A8X6KKG6_TRICU|nr:hypothetical protein TNCT_493781 [Trichonephila clavata]